jgi:DNA replication licensing factor MCM2
MDNSSTLKRRRIIVDNDDEEDGGLTATFSSSQAANDSQRQPDDDEESNPDNLLDNDSSSEEEGEDLAETWLADYAAAPELDTYDPTMLADDEEIIEDYDDIVRYRRAAEEEIDRRMRKQREQREKLAQEGLDTLDEGEEREVREEDEDEEFEEDDQGRDIVNLETFECPLREWIGEDRTRREIKRRFEEFLMRFYVGIEEVRRALI